MTLQAGQELAVAKLGASLSVAASVGSVVQDWAIGLLGVPIGVPLAAFAGVIYGLPFRSQMRPLALWANIGVSTALASVLAPLGGHLILGWFGGGYGPAAAVAGAAALLGFGSQYGHGGLRARRDRLLDRAAGIGRKEGKP